MERPWGHWQARFQGPRVTWERGPRTGPKPVAPAEKRGATERGRVLGPPVGRPASCVGGLSGRAGGKARQQAGLRARTGPKPPFALPHDPLKDGAGAHHTPGWAGVGGSPRTCGGLATPTRRAQAHLRHRPAGWIWFQPRRVGLTCAVRQGEGGGAGLGRPGGRGRGGQCAEPGSGTAGRGRLSCASALRGLGRGCSRGSCGGVTARWTPPPSRCVPVRAWRPSPTGSGRGGGRFATVFG